MPISYLLMVFISNQAACVIALWFSWLFCLISGNYLPHFADHLWPNFVVSETLEVHCVPSYYRLWYVCLFACSYHVMSVQSILTACICGCVQCTRYTVNALMLLCCGNGYLFSLLLMRYKPHYFFVSIFALESLCKFKYLLWIGSSDDPLFLIYLTLKLISNTCFTAYHIYHL